MASNLAIDQALLEEALKVSGARTKKAAVTLALKEMIARRWAEENRANIDAFNKDVEARGLWSDTMRSW